MNTKVSNWNGYNVYGDVNEIADLTDVKAFIKIDEEDVMSILSQDGTNYVSAERTSTLEDAFNQAVKNLGCPPEKIRELLIGFRCGSKQPDMMELTRLSLFLTELNPELSVKWGICQDSSLGEDYKVILLASI
ncbi:MAG: hypothetical protein K2N35_12730 [Muribaculaceae bacterium]|nr:hypothetical protein [Muribaculaceae bacterium]